jgi:hypothetical protein
LRLLLVWLGRHSVLCNRTDSAIRQNEARYRESQNPRAHHSRYFDFDRNPPGAISFIAQARRVPYIARLWPSCDWRDVKVGRANST